METRPPTPMRIAVMAGFVLSCFGLALFLWVSFGGSVPLAPQGYRVETVYRDAPGLVDQADVRISGINVGRVVDVARDGDLTRAELEIDPQYAPIPANTRTIIRRSTILGEAYIELTPGTPPDQGGTWLAEGGRLPLGHTKESVEIDELLRAFDPRTRARIKVVMHNVARALGGQGQDLNAALAYLRPLADSGADLAGVLRSQRGELSRLINDTGIGLHALAERRGALRGLVDHASGLLSATAARNRAVTESVRLLPRFLDELRTTLPDAADVGAEARPVLRAARPAVRDLPATLRDLRVAAPAARRLFEGIRALAGTAPRTLPALSSVLATARPLISNLDPGLGDLLPSTAYLERYRRELATWAAKAAAVTNALVGSGDTARHVTRFVPVLGPDSAVLHGTAAPTDRHNPDPRPGALGRVGRGGLEAFDCANAAPSPVSPPCRQQPPMRFQGHEYAYPHVRQLGG